MMRLSQRASQLKASPTLKLAARAKELATQGHDVISLTVGEPDWPTYPCISQAGHEAIDKNITKYTPANGTPDLRKAIAKRVHEDLGVEFGLQQVVVGPGTKFIIFSALQVLCNPGDEVILQAPYWVSYPTMIELSGGRPAVVKAQAENHFKLSAREFEKAITPKTKAFLFCSPSNPTGMHYTKKELQEFVEVLRKHPQIVVLSDDIYNRLLLTGERVAPHLLHLAPDLKDRVISFNGGSKAYSMTGWRIGWATGPQDIIQAIGDYQSQATGAPSSISQHALLTALEKCEPDIEKTLKVLIHRKTLAIKLLQKIPKVQVHEPTGAFYIWLDVSAYLNRRYEGQVLEDDRQISQILLEKYYVGTVPGLEAGVNGFLRLSFAVEDQRLEEACRRMDRFFSSLSS
ncbi:MAG: pyridoxal phosphate-dependent aminotransferase [Bdellovibrionales bacterium]